MPSFVAIKTILISSLLLLGSVSAAPVHSQADISHKNDASHRRPYWIGNTLVIPGGVVGGPYDKRGVQKSNPGKEIEGWLKEALREDSDLQVASMYQSDRNMVEYIEILREEVKMEGVREVNEQKVIG